ncbi:CD109 antigen-like [Ruditapes philippinarum]|uniref:CD109 antigen-like n=1 Tax=Ruditapes philippinarum TaxID=129788 RepID=UPI00295AABEC|nr:CD109 antigen-like [Ruditapes philippinarum]
MPSSVIIGEEFIVQITVFNYMTLPQTVFLQAVQSDDPNNLIPAATTVPPNEGRSTHVHVSPKHVGVLKVKVFARTGFFKISTTDAVEKELMVMHTGVQRTTNEQLLVDVNGGKTLTQTLPLVNHPDLIPGTKKVYMKISGDFLVPNTFGLERLISGPDAGAEQGLVDIAPNVILMKYLSITGQLTKAVETKALNLIRSGYQNVLAFKRGYDGSFALSGESSNYSSMWLTAFVLKSFHQARDLISVDNDVMFRAMVYLLGQQNNNGSFTESTLYTNHDKERTTLQVTAYCLVTIKECGDLVNPVRLSPAITKGQQYLESQLSTITDPYTLSIVCYALAKSGSSNGTTCYKQLAASKHAEDGYVYWPESSQAIGHMKYNSQQQSSSPAKDVETAGYAMLTFIALGFQAEGLPILKWLISQRNSRGGFLSTQDTVVAIQALAEYGIIQAHVTKQSRIQINAFGIGFMHSFNVTQMKYDSVHQIEMPANLQNVVIQAAGEGIAVVDVAQSYYVNSSSSNGTFIAVASDFEQDSLNTLILKTIVRWNGTYVSRMILMEIEMPTGFVADHDFFIKQSKVMKHESIGRTLVVYLFGIAQNSETVVKVKLDRSEPVVKNQGGTITVYDYYEPSQRAIARYESGVLKRAKICDVCPLCLFCTGFSAFSQIGIGK